MAPFKQCEYYEKGLSDFYAILTGAGGINELMQRQPAHGLAQSMNVWLRGGFPEPLIESEHNEVFYRQWFENYMADYVSRDIRSLFPRLNIHSFRRFLTLLAQFSGHQLNMSTMARALETSVPTVRDYSGYRPSDISMAKYRCIRQQSGKESAKIIQIPINYV